MGYTTSFEGGLNFNRDLTHKEWLELTELGESYDNDIYKKYTDSPETIPDSYLQWIPSVDGKVYKWNGAEKFYDYTHWLRWVIKHYMKPREIILNGELLWRGEELDDIGKITVVNNKVTTHKIEVNLTECPECGHRFNNED